MKTLLHSTCAVLGGVCACEYFWRVPRARACVRVFQLSDMRVTCSSGIARQVTWVQLRFLCWTHTVWQTITAVQLLSHSTGPL